MKTHLQNRDRTTGKYAFDGDLDRHCKCGHSLGHHLAGGYDCLNHDVGDGIECECRRFRPRVDLTLEQAASYLSDDYARQGGRFKRGQVERMAKKYGLNKESLLYAVMAKIGVGS